MYAYTIYSCYTRTFKVFGCNSRIMFATLSLWQELSCRVSLVCLIPRIPYELLWSTRIRHHYVVLVPHHWVAWSGYSSGYSPTWTLGVKKCCTTFIRGIWCDVISVYMTPSSTPLYKSSSHSRLLWLGGPGYNTVSSGVNVYIVHLSLYLFSQETGGRLYILEVCKIIIYTVWLARNIVNGHNRQPYRSCWKIPLPHSSYLLLLTLDSTAPACI